MSIRGKIIKRFTVIYFIVLFAFLCVIAKMFYIQTIERSEWEDVAKQMESKEVPIVPNRGNIYTCNGELIAATIPYYTLLMDTRVPALHEKGGALYRENIDSLCICLSRKFKDKSPKEYREMIDKAYRNGNGSLKLYPHKVSYVDLQEIKKFPLIRKGRYKSGFMTREYANRENLYGDLCSRTIGNVYGAGQGGQYGLELQYDSILKGMPGIERQFRAGTSWVYETIKKPVDGMDLITTIDIVKQDICDKSLRDMLIKTDAERGCMVLMDVKTGEIRACVNLSRESRGVYRETYNMAVGDMSEPGSTFKTISLITALEDGKCKPKDKVDTQNGEYKIYSVIMTDHNRKRGGFGIITIDTALAQSSNIGISRMIFENYKNNPSEFVDGIYRTKINEDMHIEIPGAGKPVIPHPSTAKNWSGTSLPWMSIGYVVQIPPIYTLAFYNAIANDGRMVKPHFVKAIMNNGEAVKVFNTETINPSICSNNTLKEIREMLKGVTEYGTGKDAASEIVPIAGKTGTAQLGYGTGARVTHQISFCGYFPADEPKYSAIVVIRKPRIGYPAGGTMCGGVFKQAAERIYALEHSKSIHDISYIDEKGDKKENLPSIKNGNRKAIENVLDETGVNYNFENVDWIRTVKGENSQLTSETVPVILNKYVPNVVGMGAKDAVYLIEKCGMNVHLTGKGKVVSQSVRNGATPIPGGTVYLTLK